MELCGLVIKELASLSWSEPESDSTPSICHHRFRFGFELWFSCIIYMKTTMFHGSGGLFRLLLWSVLSCLFWQLLT